MQAAAMSSAVTTPAVPYAGACSRQRERRARDGPRRKFPSTLGRSYRIRETNIGGPLRGTRAGSRRALRAKPRAMSTGDNMLALSLASPHARAVRDALPTPDRN